MRRIFRYPCKNISESDACLAEQCGKPSVKRWGDISERDTAHRGEFAGNIDERDAYLAEQCGKPSVKRWGDISECDTARRGEFTENISECDTYLAERCGKPRVRRWGEISESDISCGGCECDCGCVCEVCGSRDMYKDCAASDGGCSSCLFWGVLTVFTFGLVLVIPLILDLFDSRCTMVCRRCGHRQRIPPCRGKCTGR